EEEFPMGLPESATAGSSERGQAAAGANISAMTVLGLAFSVGASSLIVPAQPAAAVSTPQVTAQEITVTHIVREGETLWSLAQRYGVTPKSIALANDIDADSLRVGQAIDIVTAYHSNYLEETPAVTTPIPLPAKSVVGRVVEPSRNLAQIQVQQVASPFSESAKVVGSPTPQGSKRDKAKLLASPKVSKALAEQNADQSISLSTTPSVADSADDAVQPIGEAALNDLANRADIAQVIKGEPSSEAREQNAVQSSEYSVAASSGWASQLGREAGATATTTHTIRVGETLSSIARARGMSIEALVALNGIRNPNRVFVGQVLTVPATPRSEPVPDIVQTVVQEPVRLAAALPIALPASEATSLPEAVRNSAQPRTDQPQATAPASEQIDAQPAETDLNVYVEDLQDDIQVMADASVAEEASVGEIRSEAKTEADTAVAVALHNADAIARDSVDDDAVNPEFAASRSTAAADNGVDQPEALSNRSNEAGQDEETLVASAPLGSENYAPLAEPVTGRMVSPELPPLSDPENHLPGVTMPMDGYLWPASGLLTSGYGWRWGRMHQGIDVAAPVGTPIVAAAPGVIEFSGWNSGGYGNMVDIRHPDGNKTRYAHNSRNLVRVGQKVNQGEQIAEMGSTGYSTGPHVHFEIHVPSQGAVNPVAMLPSR
ncbi:MAG: peptidoglycan DD-metalloendopeptidase family protein, partial [Elainellaceae cyanobacterium]